MGVTSLVAEVATRRVHVFLVEAPGRSLLRMTVQAAIARRGWVEATGPADADALVVCGQPDGELRELIDAVWEQIPSPRTRGIVATEESLVGTLDIMPVALRDDAHQRADARTRRLRVDDHRGPNPAPTSTENTHMSHDHQHNSHDHGQGPGVSSGEASGPDMPMDPADPMDMGSDGAMDMGSDGHMDMGMGMGMDMDMSGPAGIALAGGSDDRDGLEMDETHLTLGPLLSGWPADLILHCTLHGDVVTDARVHRLPGGGRTEQPPETARLLDDAARLLMLAGWEPAAQELARLRNESLHPMDPERTLVRLRRVTARARHSRTLRWTLKSISTVGGTPVRDRLLQWLDTAQELLTRPAIPAAAPVHAVAPEEIRRAVLGQELSATRLIVAALGTHITRTSDAVTHE